MGRHPFVRSVERQEIDCSRKVGSGERKSRGEMRKLRQLYVIAEIALDASSEYSQFFWKVGAC
jgi:hypothetical protein